jgi:hypothetical protein
MTVPLADIIVGRIAVPCAVEEAHRIASGLKQIDEEEVPWAHREMATTCSN